MSFVEDIAKLSEQVRKRAEQVVGEEATKQALILPFLSTLGYDIWDPTEVIPEFISDSAKKKAGQFEKVDYAVAINSTIVMLIEAKARGQKTEAHDGQLDRYFSWTKSAKVSIVTNGIEYRFFTDLREKNLMDKEPFFSFSILEFDTKDIENLKLFHRDNFDVNAISQNAEEMVYVKGMTELVGNLLRTPSDAFVRFLINEMGEFSPNYAIESRISNRVIEKFKPIVKKSIQSSLVDLMTRSISQEITQVPAAVAVTPAVVETVTQDQQVEEAISEDDSNVSKVITTDEELQAFEKIKEITSKSNLPSRKELGYKDVVSYFGVHVGKPAWWFLRLYLSPKRKSLVTRLSVEEVKSLCSDFEVQEIGASLGEAASRVVISSIDDLDKIASLILRCYEMESDRH